MEIFITVNWIAIVIAAVARFVVGAMWYSPMVFGKQWKETVGSSPSEVPEAIAVQAVGSLVMAYVLAQIIGHIGATDLWTGAVVGLMMWLGFVASIMLPGVMFEKRPMNFFFIYSGYQLVTMLVMGAIIAVW
ncbi:hypothetical protein A2752_02040 [Candidatus Uhrbacteria bacterium RIFCSPHIGHO2_01_FULL_46_23]|nr:MAG: hypothetical protein A2752_02040 [Candidatus Uhrbacteria bacterium RIFCSPHIGHO2_01_FULL_46_23]